MQFRVPQFIDVEDKIFGPLTLKQFIYCLGAAGFAFLLWTLIPYKIISIILILPVSGLFLGLAFLKINDRPFIDFLENGVKYFTNPRIYTWKQPNPTIKEDYAKTITEATKKTVVSHVENGRLREIAFGLDVLDRKPQEEEEK
jgi:hypothetical protein